MAPNPFGEGEEDPDRTVIRAGSKPNPGGRVGPMAPSGLEATESAR